MRLAILALSFSVSACAAQRPEVRTLWLPAYGFGIFDGGTLDLRDVCPSGGAEELSIGSSWASLGISAATLGVYTPREVRVRCAPER